MAALQMQCKAITTTQFSAHPLPANAAETSGAKENCVKRPRRAEKRPTGLPLDGARALEGYDRRSCMKWLASSAIRIVAYIPDICLCQCIVPSPILASMTIAYRRFAVAP